jgi:protein-tyrosine phosphatase
VDPAASGDRIVRLERVLNVRELGGLQAADRRRVVPGRLYRSASLHEMSDADRGALEARGVATVLDLRSSWERSRQPVEWPGVRVVAAPLAEDAVVASITERFEHGRMEPDALEDWWRLTGLYDAPHRHPDSIRTVFDTLLDAGPDGAILWHCRGGKDRTGVVSALVLAALGVRDDEITADFLLSNVMIDTHATAAELAERFNRELSTSLTAASVFSLAGVRQEWLAELLGRIRDRNGSVTGYLTGPVGLSAADLAELRSRYLDEGGAA